MATVNISGVWKIVEGTAAEIVQALQSDGIVDPKRVAAFTHNGTAYAIVYRFK